MGGNVAVVTVSCDGAWCWECQVVSVAPVAHHVIPCHLVNDSAAANNLGTVAKSLHSLNPCLETFKTWDYILELIRHYLSMYYIMIFIIGMVINIMTLYDKIFEEYNVGKLERERMKNLDNSRTSR